MSVSTQFLADLELVHASLAGATLDFAFLAERLELWRRDTQQRLAEMLQRVPKDDPLLCPVSLFGTMDYGRLEVAHTRTLAWLFDPTKEHRFKDALLQALLGQLRGTEDCRDFSIGPVQSEYPIESGSGKGGRIDILAEGEMADLAGRRQRWMLVVEAKIDAAEGEDQLGRYDGWIENHSEGRRVLRVFLTPGGWQGETGGAAWQALSFLELVRILRPVMESLREAPGYHFLRYYLSGVLRDVCGWPLPMTADYSDPYAVVRYLAEMHR